MDMTTIKRKLDGCQYKSAKDCLNDFDRMFQNCYTYNRPTEDVTIMAKKVQEFLHSKVKNMPPVEVVLEAKKKTGNLPKASPINLGVPPPSDIPPVMVPSPLAPSISESVSEVAPSPSPSPSLTGSGIGSGMGSGIGSGIGSNQLSVTPPALTPNNSSASMPSLQAAPIREKRPARTVTTKRKPDQAAPFDDATPVKKTKQGETPKRKDMKICAAVLKELFQKRHQVYAWPFYQPVDVEGLKLHDYHEVIKKPMDLSTIQKNMDGNVYTAKEEFSGDVKMIFENCYVVSI